MRTPTRSRSLLLTARQTRWDKLLQRWERSSSLDISALEDLDRLVADYRFILAEIAWLQNIDPRSPYIHRLQTVAQRLHWLLHQGNEMPFQLGFGPMLQYGIPAIFQRNFGTFRMVLTIALVGVLFTFTLVNLEDRFALSVLPLDAIQQLRQGHSWLDNPALFPPPSLMSLSIIRNNTMVAVYLYIAGLTLGIGTFFILWKNLMMLGAIFALGFKYGALGSVTRFIAAHGFLEISGLLVETTAGFILARGMIERKRVPRHETLRFYVRESWLLFLGTLPWIALAGIVEGYVSTRYTLIPDEVRLGLGLFIGILLWLYLLRPIPPQYRSSFGLMNFNPDSYDSIPYYAAR